MDVAKDRFLKEDYDLACFLAEQAVQLYLKAALLCHTEDVSRSHSIRTLISMLFNSTKNEELLELSKKNKLALKVAGTCVYCFQYLFERFDKDDAENAIRVAEKVFNVVQRLFGDINEAS